MYLGLLPPVALFVHEVWFYFFSLSSLQTDVYGREEESLFALWKFIRGESVFVNPLEIPYTASFFNYLFYTVYGYWTEALQRLFGLEDLWLTTLGRSCSFSFAVLAAMCTYLCLRALKASKSLALLGACYLLTAPIVGINAFTTRPDIASFACLAAAMIFVLRGWQREMSIDWLFASLLFYLAWAFKQSEIAVFTAVSISLLATRRIRPLLVTVVSFGALVLLTFLIAPPSYASSLFVVGVAPFSVAVGAKSFFFAFVRAAPSFTVLFLGMCHLKKTLPFSRQDADVVASQPQAGCFCLLVFTGIITLVLNFLASLKAGSGFNYFLASHLIGTLLIFHGKDFEDGLKDKSRFLIAASFFHIVFCLVLLFDRRPYQVHRDNHHRMMQLRTCVSQLPEPVYVASPYGELPWINPSPPHFVLSSHYDWYTAEETGLEAGGIDGLIESGKFNSLVFSTLEVPQAAESCCARAKSPPQACEGFVVLTTHNQNTESGIDIR